MKRRTGLRLGKQPSDKPPYNRATDSKQRSHYETKVLRTRHYGARDQTDNEPDNDGPNDV